MHLHSPGQERSRGEMVEIVPRHLQQSDAGQTQQGEDSPFNFQVMMKSFQQLFFCKLLSF